MYIPTKEMWTVRPRPVHGEGSFASDPTIIKDGSIYRMFYTGTDPAQIGRSVIHQATSPDGLTWTDLPQWGVAANAADERIEGAAIVKVGTKYILMYSVYKNGWYQNTSLGAFLHHSVSTDGVNFTRVPGPILSPTRGWYDNDAIFSPDVVKNGSQYLMLYAGHQYSNMSATGGGGGVFILGATSTDGVRWTKQPEPILRPNGTGWMRDGVAEPCLVKGFTDRWYLFFTGLQGDQRVIGVAHSTKVMTGPWEIHPEPILLPFPGFAEHWIIAPEVLADTVPGAEGGDERFRMWFTGQNNRDHWNIGYAEAPALDAGERRKMERIQARIDARHD